MIFIYLLIGCCEAGFKILNNRGLNNSEVEFPSLILGNYFFFPIYGKVIYLEPSSECNFNVTSKLFPIFILTSLTNNCSALDLISSKSLSEVSLILFISDSSHQNKALTTTNKIQGLFIDETYAKSMNDSKVIWASYKTSFKKHSTTTLIYFLTSNYTEDRYFIGNLTYLLSKSKSIDVDIGFSYKNESDSNCKDERCCFIDKRSTNTSIYTGDPTSNISTQQTYCLNRTMLENSIYFINLLHKSQSKDIPNKNYIAYDFLSSLAIIYKACIADYSEECIIRILGKKDELNSTYFVTNEEKEIIPKYKINECYFYSNDLLISAYCNSIENPDSWCTCGDSCKYSFLKQDRLYSNCNISECGYNGDLRGLLVNEIDGNMCYTFMLNDGNCDDYCNDDPDCNDPDNKSDDLDSLMYALITGIFLIWGFLFVVFRCKRSNKHIGKYISNVEIIEHSHFLLLAKEEVENLEMICKNCTKDISSEDNIVKTRCNNFYDMPCFTQRPKLMHCPACDEKQDMLPEWL